MTFLWPFQIYPDRQPHSTPDNIENSQLPSPITIQDNIDEDHPNSEHKTEQVASNHCLPEAPPLDFIYEWERSVKPKTLVLSVEPVLDLTQEQQEKQEEDPKITLGELLGLSSCEGYIQTPLQTLDGLYVNQPS